MKSKKSKVDQKVKKVYSEDWKREKIRLLEAGELRAVDLARLYGLATSSVYRWRKLYGKESPIETVVMEQDSDYLKCLSMQKQIDKQHSTIGKMHIQIDYLKTVIAQINKLYNIDAEKKFGLTRIILILLMV